jgi:uncharacterized protein YndB with AHSA1/START domain
MKLIAALLFATAAPVAAGVTASAPDGFVSRNEAVVPLAPAQVWAALVQWDRWWSPEHSYSGKAPRLNPVAGGGLVESWPGGEVWHAGVVNALPPKLLRLNGGFGPLQSLPVNAVLDFVLIPEGGGTKLVMIYRVAGNATADLDKLAVPVDAVMSGGFARLTRFATTGKPE